MLLFDEMSISAELHYNGTLDRIEGFEDYGYERTQQFADHALVFMIWDIIKSFNSQLPISLANDQQVVNSLLN